MLLNFSQIQLPTKDSLRLNHLLPLPLPLLYCCYLLLLLFPLLLLPLLLFPFIFLLLFVFILPNRKLVSVHDILARRFLILI